VRPIVADTATSRSGGLAGKLLARIEVLRDPFVATFKIFSHGGPCRTKGSTRIPRSVALDAAISSLSCRSNLEVGSASRARLVFVGVHQHDVRTRVLGRRERALARVATHR
jgi:hypothetical protein